MRQTLVFLPAAGGAAAAGAGPGPPSFPGVASLDEAGVLIPTAVAAVLQLLMRVCLSAGVRIRDKAHLI